MTMSTMPCGAYHILEYEQGFAFPDCDVAGLEKLIVPIARQTDNGTQKVSVRLDSKTGTEIASATLDKSKG